MAFRNCLLLAASLALTLGLINVVKANSDGDALIALKQSLSDPNNALQSWDGSLVDPCTWFHITCNSDNRVTRVDLGRYNLSGHLVPELGNLDTIQYLELYGNHIEGTIPSELGNLKNIMSLDLYENSLTGIIPPSLGNSKSLLFLRLNNNQLTGPIPIELTTIPSLKVADLSSNDLSGTIPRVGSFAGMPPEFFKNNPRLKGPGASYDTNST